MIIFLDFDGVTHPETAGDESVFSRVEFLWRILRACPQVNVVFSSSWREIYSPDSMVDFVTANGGEDLIHRFVGGTPSLIREARANYAGPFRKRELECRVWLRDNDLQEEAWLALDDVAYGFCPDSPNLYLVDPLTGLTEADVQAIIALIYGESER